MPGQATITWPPDSSIQNVHVMNGGRGQTPFTDHLLRGHGGTMVQAKEPAPLAGHNPKGITSHHAPILPHRQGHTSIPD
jgi:hypothetical protein